MGRLMSQTKPFDISKWEVKEAWEEVRANKGAPGVDGESIDEFEKDLRNNLYKVRNRMSSGSYFPSPVRAVEIPKPHGGGMRMPCWNVTPSQSSARPSPSRTRRRRGRLGARLLQRSRPR